MKNMTIPELYKYLNSAEFMNPDGNMFYNYYIYQYEASQEYKMRRDIIDFKEKLVRPTSYMNVMTIDLFETFCDFLSSKMFGGNSVLEEVLEDDKQNRNTVTAELTEYANSDDFIKYINQLIDNHMEIDDNLNKSYVFIYGIGKIFPYLRTNVFLTKYEQYNDTSRYKIILFYPGREVGNSFSLFDVLEDSHTYRATLLVNR